MYIMDCLGRELAARQSRNKNGNILFVKLLKLDVTKIRAYISLDMLFIGVDRRRNNINLIILKPGLESFREREIILIDIGFIFDCLQEFKHFCSSLCL